MLYAGISHNKLLAKLASAMNKPNKQTVVPYRSVDTLMATLPLKKIRNFGGKVGQALEELGCATAGDVQRLPQTSLTAKFGERAGCVPGMCKSVQQVCSCKAQFCSQHLAPQS